MMPRITTINCVAFLWLVMFVTFTNAQNEILECTIRDGRSEIHLKLKMTEQLLVNENLPVWIARPRPGPHFGTRGPVKHNVKHNLIKDEIGDLVFYHDLERSSAVVLYKRTNTLVGVIDTRYTILVLPLDQCNAGVDVGGEYVKFMNCDSMNPIDHLKVLDLSMPRNGEPVVNHDEPPTVVPDDDWLINLYPEIMVFIPYDITTQIKIRYPSNYLAIIVAQHIMYFNAVDMLISKLSTFDIKIHINLAGIVIEDEENMFDFLKPSIENIGCIDAGETLDSFPRYAEEHYGTFHELAFDFFFILTSKSLWYDEINEALDGLSALRNVFKIRQRKKSSRTWPGVIVEYLCGFEYIVASHEIAHLMNIDHDPLDKGCDSITVQCYGIMQQKENTCPDCLKWSDESVIDLMMYARHNPDHCYLLNRPRSLHPYGSRMRTLLPSEQCRCYGFEPRTPNHGSKRSDVIPLFGCGQALTCSKGSKKKNLPFPIDGTPCEPRGVCWYKKCQSIREGL